MKHVLFIVLNFFLMHDSTNIRLELNYDREAKELQIHITGKDRLQLVQIYCGEKLLVEFDEDQIPPWDNTVRMKVSCSERCRFYYVIQTKDGSVFRIKSKKSNLEKNGTYVEIE